jgi:hypothetical protein
MLPPESPANTLESSKHGLFLTVLGLVLTVIGLIALVELLPRLSATYLSPVNPSDVLRTNFTVTNDGYFRLTDVRSGCFVWAVWIDPKNLHKTDPDVGYAWVSTENPLNKVLYPNEAFTVPCVGGSHASSLVPPMGAGDIAIVVSFRPWPFSFVKRRKLFRFVSRVNNGEAFWDRQPSYVIEKDFDKFAASNSAFGSTDLNDFR